MSEAASVGGLFIFALVADSGLLAKAVLADKLLSQLPKPSESKSENKSDEHHSHCPHDQLPSTPSHDERRALPNPCCGGPSLDVMSVTFVMLLSGQRGREYWLVERPNSCCT